MCQQASTQSKNPKLKARLSSHNKPTAEAAVATVSPQTPAVSRSGQHKNKEKEEGICLTGGEDRNQCRPNDVRRMHQPAKRIPSIARAAATAG